MTTYIEIQDGLWKIAEELPIIERESYAGVHLPHLELGFYVARMDLDRPCVWPKDYYGFLNSIDGVEECRIPKEMEAPE